MINLQHIYKEYTLGAQQVIAVNDVSLSVEPGEIYGVIGPSGAGKSTLVRCVNLLERPSRGKVIVAGQDLCLLDSLALRQARRKISMIFQGFNLLSSANVYQNVALPLKIAGATQKEIEDAVLPLLELTGMRDRRNDYPSQLSGGQKQRVAIARALVNKPKVLLSDEATSALDPRTTHTILRLLKQINEQFNLTILMITHEMEVVKEICHRLSIMEHGKVVEQADVVEFFTNPQTDLAKTFINKRVKQQLPQSVTERLTDTSRDSANPLWHMSFLGQVAQEPLISQLMQQHDISLNILQADIEPIRDQVVGTMVVEVVAKSENDLRTGQALLQSKGVHIETIGHVSKISQGEQS